MRFLVQLALILTVLLLLVQAFAAPEIGTSGQLWSEIAIAVHNVGIQ
jgi:hypothetical protein